jgi:hypothetical protein
MNSCCPHCGGKLPTASLLRSATGIVRYFDCQRCMRHLSVSSRCKIAYASILALTLVSCSAYDFEKSSHAPFLGFPIVAVLASLAVCRRARVRRFHSSSMWALMLNYGILGLALCAVSFASTQ